MADPLGILGLVAVIGQIIYASTQFGQDWKNAPDDAKTFIVELGTLKTALSETHTNIVVNRNFQNAIHGLPSALQAPAPSGDAGQGPGAQVTISACHAALEVILEDLKKRAQTRHGWERLRGAFLAKAVRETVENVHRQCVALNQLVTIDAVTLAVSTHQHVKQGMQEQQQIRQGVDSLRLNQDNREAAEERSRVLDWVTTTDFALLQSDLSARRQAETGQWLPQSAEFRTWIQAKGQTLFCPGIPGAGKTILTSAVVDELVAHSQEAENKGSIGVAYIYCNFRRQDKAEDLLASLVRQLAQGQPSLPGVIRSLYARQSGKPMRPSFDDFSAALRSVLSLYAKAFIVVDALDECPISEGCRSRFISEIIDLQSRTGANIFTTSRFIPEITQIFQDTATVLEIRARDEDVRKYLASRMFRLPAFIGRRAELQEEIITEITKAADGMYVPFFPSGPSRRTLPLTVLPRFQLVELHLQALVGKTSPKALRNALHGLTAAEDPYGSAYSEAIERIEGQVAGHRQLGIRVLSWIVYARRPLTILELQQALGVEVGACDLDQDNLDDIQLMVSTCAGLVTVDSPSCIIRLVHRTAQEFFERRRGQIFPSAEEEIASACATTLSFDAFGTGFCITREELEQRFRSYPFYRYAAQHWGYHARTASLATPYISRLIVSTARLEAAFQAIWAAWWPSGLPLDDESVTLGRQSMTGLHCSAYFGMQTLTQDLINTQLELDATDREKRSPLSWAAENGHVEIVRLLLSTGRVNPDLPDWHNRTPLSWAAEQGHHLVAELLLENGHIDVNSPERNGGFTPLSYAAENGHEAVAKVLLTADYVNPECMDRIGRSSLSIAAEAGSHAVVKALLDYGVIVESDYIRIDDRTALSYAAEGGHVEVVKLLLQSGQVDVNARDRKGRTPLCHACANATISPEEGEGDFEGFGGQEAVARLLIENGADFDTRDDAGRTPLWYAEKYSCHAMIGILRACYAGTEFPGLSEISQPIKPQSSGGAAALPAPVSVVMPAVPAVADPPPLPPPDQDLTSQ